MAVDVVSSIKLISLGSYRDYSFKYLTYLRVDVIPRLVKSVKMCLLISMTRVKFIGIRITCEKIR